MQLVEVKNPTPVVRTWTDPKTGEVIKYPELECWMQIDAFGYPEKTKLSMPSESNVQPGWYFIPDSNFYLNQAKFGTFAMGKIEQPLISADEKKIRAYMSIQLNEVQLNQYMESRK